MNVFFNSSPSVYQNLENKITSVKIRYDEMMNPVLNAVKTLGGSGTNELLRRFYTYPENV